MLTFSFELCFLDQSKRLNFPLFNIVKTTDMKRGKSIGFILKNEAMRTLFNAREHFVIIGIVHVKFQTSSKLKIFYQL